MIRTINTHKSSHKTASGFSRRTVVKSLGATTIAGSSFTSINNAAAQNRYRNIFTWNMQGATNGNDSKWANGVLPLFTKDEFQADVICLQEAGALPGGVARFNERGQLINNATPNYDVANLPPQRWFAQNRPDRRFTWSYVIWPKQVAQNQYNYNTRGEIYKIFWLQTDDQNEARTGRVNMAIATRHDPDFLCFVAGAPRNDQIGNNGRPAVGFGFEQRHAGTGALTSITCYFSIHATSPNGPDAIGLLDNIGELVTAAAIGYGVPVNWIVGGDFNRHPASITTVNSPTSVNIVHDRTIQPAGVYIGPRASNPVPPNYLANAIVCPPNRATHRSGGFYDYFVSNFVGAHAKVPFRRLDRLRYSFDDVTTGEDANFQSDHSAARLQF